MLPGGLSSGTDLGDVEEARQKFLPPRVRLPEGDVTDFAIMFFERITGSKASLASAPDTLAKMNMQPKVTDDLRDVLRDGVTRFLRSEET